MDKLIINELPLERVRGKLVFVRIDTDAEQPSPAIFDEIKLRSSLPTLDLAPILHHESGLKKSLLQLAGMLLGAGTILVLHEFLG